MTTRAQRLALAGCIVLAACSSDAEQPAKQPPIEPPPDPPAAAFELVGHNDLLARGMNAAPALIGDHLYVGSRTEGGTHDTAGILIVDVSNPAAPAVVGHIGAPEQDIQGMTSRELRALPDDDLLIVLNFPCSEYIHDCTRNVQRFSDTAGAAERANLKFYDVADPLQPQLVATFEFPRPNGSTTPHEFYLWRDPANPDRKLVYVSMPLGPPSLLVLDISDVNNITTAASWDTQEDGGLDEIRSGDALLHSIGLTDDGAIGFISHQGGGLLLLDTAPISAGEANPQINLLHAVDRRVDWTPPHPPGAHSAVPIPGRPLVLVTDEIYPQPMFDGCPWGWARFVDYTDVQNPFLLSEHKLVENDPAACPAEPTLQANITYTAHNATVTENLAFITWHAGGLRVLDTTDAAAPVETLVFMPEPLPSVATEDPALGGHPVAMWSYPIIRDGLIYVVDIRNGLYILRYTGPYEEQLADTFREGNSNVH